MLAMVKATHPDIDLPSGFGKKWTDTEEQQLLNELEIQMDLETIAQNHNRTAGGIRSRINGIMYQMYTDGKPINEIMKQLNKTEEECNAIISHQTTKDKNKQQRSEMKKMKKTEQSGSLLPSEADHSTEVDVIKTELTSVKTDLTSVKTELVSVKTDLTSVKKELTIIKTEVRSLTKMMKHLTMILESIYDIETPP